MSARAESPDAELSIRRGEHVPCAPQVSVLVPAYLRSKDECTYLDAALDSVRAQTFRDFEIIVIDDGSPLPLEPARTDDLVLIRQPNTGPGGARNRGAAHARGSLLALLDSDDRWTPDKLAKQVALHARRPDLVLSCTNFTRFDERGPRHDVALKDPARDGIIPFERVFYENCIACASVVMRKDAFDRTPGMHAHRRMGEDYGLWLRMAQLGPIGFLDEVTLERRVHGASLMQEQLRDGSSLEKEREIYLEFLGERPDLREEVFVRRAMARLEFELGWTNLARHDFRAARAALVRSLRLDPLRPKAWIDLVRATLHVPAHPTRAGA